MASNSFKVKNSLVLTPKDLATLVSPEAGDLACDINDSNKIKRYDVNSASWVEVGSGGGVGGTDIFFVQDFESASLSSFTQTGLTLSQTDPLHGRVSALLTHQPAVNQSFKQIIPVDRKFRGETMTLRLNCKSNAPAGDVTIKIYDETNAANLVASQQLQLSNDASGAISRVGFTIPETCASISYTITALPEAGSPVTRIDDIIAELAVTSLLETSVVVPVLTAWQGYTPTFQGFGTPSAVEFEWRQVGENVEIRGKFVFGTPTAVEARIGLPAGLSSAGTSLIPSLQIAGTAGRSANSTTETPVVLIEPSVSYVTIGVSNGAVAALTKRNGDALAGSGQAYALTASVPCSGLSATTSTSIPLTQSGLIQEADSMIRLDTSNGYGSTNTVIRRFSTVRESIGSDVLYTDSATAGASFTVLTSGTYDISFTDQFTAASTLGITRNSTQLTTQIGSILPPFMLASNTTGGASFSGNVSWEGYLVAGDIIRAHTNGQAVGATNVTSFTMSRQGSLKQVRVNTNSKITIPTSELRFEGASARGAVATAIVRFDAMVKIRGDAFSVVSTAANGTAITMLKAGKLDISASLLLNGALAITRNQLVLNSFGVSNPTASEIIAIDQGSSDRASAAASVFVNVGDVLRVASDINPTSSVSNNISFSFQEQDIQVSVTNTLPTFSESDSSVRVDTANGYGSTATKIRRFSNVRDNIGTDVEYVDSATSGASFIAKTSGIYNISYSDNPNAAGGVIALSKNASSLTASPLALATSEVLGLSAISTAGGYIETVSWQGYLNAGDIIRGQTSGEAAATIASCNFTMSKVGKPNVTGVNVTPFVNVPQIDRQSTYAQISAPFTSTVTGALTSSNGSGIYSYNSSTGIYTMLKSAKVDITYTAQATATNLIQLQIVVTSLGSVSISANDAASGTSWATASYSGILQSGETFSVICNPSGSVHRITVVAEALSDQILTVPETFSTDTAALTYAGSGTYTLATLANAPVGTYVTFTYAASTNTRTQTSTRPTQTDADMNANGIMLTSRVYAAASTAALPSTVAVQVGKGLKGCAISAFAATAKAGSCSLDFLIEGNTTTQEGVKFKDYDEKTGIVFLDVGYNQSSIINTNRLLRSDTLASTTTPYFVINASKNPALTGMNLNRVAATYQTDSGQSIPQATVTQLVFEDRVLDSSGAMNTGTGVYTIPENGVYSIQMKFSFGGSTNWTIGEVAIGYIRVNGVEKSYSRWNCVATTGATTFIEVPVVIYQARLAKGDAITLHAYQDSGAALSVIASAKINQFIVTKVSE